MEIYAVCIDCLEFLVLTLNTCVKNVFEVREEHVMQ